MELNAKMQINVEPDKAYEAFVDPAKIGRFWFSSSSERWETGKTIQLQYKEYDATTEIFIKETIPNEQIKFQWGTYQGEICFEPSAEGTIVSVREYPYHEQDVQMMLDKTEGWVYMLTCLKSYLEFNAIIRDGLR
ncbi:SRPBCC domain-containing protein [Staphylococcus lugdunensis]|uniref:SRPBCC domain-containing protein n=1 Tax=Staphylococcus lugdunensis TaxID=28035 RepID=UPI0020962D06|nr:SRPBCC domain-containing protein [Staphylococcus lugdunensis]MCO6563478.1 SRPBCC domain-containing protein [Staphylococcus lugdunensis]MCO6567039.1 SRPBCC domain-containing protein [Staphylococcus lugdunensis]MCO6570047.1 SRPBCC domain-containing protein [Staphylococcus lugdunensis]MCO6571956.1 SRPBCC domain-containing protein [Staphylococcus lugdunensis]MCO6589550.1 SRPBCC domain-containing protein [Staphylococcus lugdunensis]